MDFVTFQWTAGVIEKFTTAQPPLYIFAFVAGDERTAALAARVIAHVPWNWKLVLAFDQESRFSNEWVSRMWPDKYVRVISWHDDGAPYNYYWLVDTCLQRHKPPGTLALESTALSRVQSVLVCVSCAAGTGAYEEELLERTRVYLPAGADVVLDLSQFATFANMVEGRRFSRRLPRIERRLSALIKVVRLASQCFQ